jgi:hypothetical protein
MVSVCRPLVVRVIFGTVLSLTIFAAQFRCNVAIPWVKWLFAGLSPRRPGFVSRSVHLGFVVDEMALEQVFLQVLRFYPVNIIPP